MNFSKNYCGKSSKKVKKLLIIIFRGIHLYKIINQKLIALIMIIKFKILAIIKLIIKWI